MTIQTYYVTPGLLLGTAPPAMDNCTETSEAEHAVEIIRGGQIAVLPIDGWQTARHVLTVLGLPSDEIEDRIQFAMTARVGASGKTTEYVGTCQERSGERRH